MLKRGAANAVVILAYNLKMRKIADTTKTQVAARISAASGAPEKSALVSTGGLKGMGDRSNSVLWESNDLVRREQQALRNWRKTRGRETDPWTGIALSGGGIRSATFCLGVLQALASKDRLKHFDYMSTVSGGGFIGCSLQWWWHRPNPIGNGRPNLEIEKLGSGKEDFPFGTDDPSPSRDERGDDVLKQARLKHLRDHGNYLAPGSGITYWSGVGAVLRAIVLNLLVWIPLVGITFYAIRSFDYAIGPALAQLGDGILPPAHAFYKALLVLAVLAVAFFLLACVFYSFQTSTSEEGRRQSRRYWPLFVLAIVMAIIGLVWALSSPRYSASIATGIQTIVAPALFIVVVIVASALLWKVVLITVVHWYFPQGVGEAYAFRRMIDRSFGAIFPYFVLVLAIGIIPIVFDYVLKASPGSDTPGFASGVLAVTAGAATTLWGYYQLFRNIAPRLATRLFLPLGGGLFLAGVAVLGYHFGETLSFDGGGRQIALWTLVLLAFVSGLMVNTNQIGLNRFYRDRLMEAYMPGITGADKGRSSPADSVCLHQLWPGNPGVASKESNRPETQEETTWPGGPYPLINTNVVLINDKDPIVRIRGGDNFILSPYFCGSQATGWRHTEVWGDVTLPSAMAASGAAVNPFTGYVGTGPTRGRLVSIVMALLNLRLGYWVRNPQRASHPPRWPNHIFPGLWYAVFKRGHRRESHFLELTDGGHFDNLGFYELVRRKCKVILVCDGEADKQTSYGALVSAQRRIKDDFGARIIFDSDEGPELLVEREEMAYPSGAFMAKQPFFVATIVYEDGSEGKIIYIKTRMIKELSFQVKAYRGAYPDFPHETTGDQFFDPAQFDAHCELGYRACNCALSNPRVQALLPLREVDSTRRGSGATARPV